MNNRQGGRKRKLVVTVVARDDRDVWVVRYPIMNKEGVAIDRKRFSLPRSIYSYTDAEEWGARLSRAKSREAWGEGSGKVTMLLQMLLEHLDDHCVQTKAPASVVAEIRLIRLVYLWRYDTHHENTKPTDTKELGVSATFRLLNIRKNFKQINVPLETFRRRDVMMFRKYLLARGLKADSTVGMMINLLRSACRWTIQMEYIDTNPATDIKPITLANRVPDDKVFSPRELDRVFIVLESDKTNPILRQYCRLLYLIGCGAGDLYYELNPDRIDWDYDFDDEASEKGVRGLLRLPHVKARTRPQQIKRKMTLLRPLDPVLRAELRQWMDSGSTWQWSYRLYHQRFCYVISLPVVRQPKVVVEKYNQLDAEYWLQVRG